MKSDPNSVNYPDILGLITGGERLNVDVIQCALTTRPETINAGKSFEVLFLVQNASDIDIDVTISLKLPDRDAKNRRGRFFSKSSRLLVGLQPAEVGLVILPASCSPKTEPSGDYKLSADIKVERLTRNRKPMRIRKNEGGGEVIFSALPEENRQQIQTLRQQSWETHHRGRRNHIEATFKVDPPGLSSLIEFKAGWESLWTMRDYLDESLLEKRVQEHVNVILPVLTDKEAIFQPLLSLTTETFHQRGNYPLKKIEALYITKLLVLVLTELHTTTTSTAPREQPSDVPNLSWYKELLKLLFEDSRYRDHPTQAIKNHLYPFILKDAVLHGFKMIATVLNEDFGSVDEQAEYADTVVSVLKNGGQLSYGQVYLPLIGGGVIANARITMPQENVRETAFAISEANEGRTAEKTEDNAFVFSMMKTLIDRAIDSITGF